MKKVILTLFLASQSLISGSVFAEWLPGVRSARDIKDLQIAREVDADALLGSETAEVIEEESQGTSSGMFDTFRPDGSLGSGRSDEKNPVRSNLG